MEQDEALSIVEHEGTGPGFPIDENDKPIFTKDAQ